MKGPSVGTMCWQKDGAGMSGEGCGGSNNYEEYVSEKMADEAEKW